MNEETQFISKPKTGTDDAARSSLPDAASAPDSRICNVSVRAWITVILVVTACVMSVMQLKIDEPLYGLVGMAVGFYLGQKKSS